MKQLAEQLFEFKTYKTIKLDRSLIDKSINDSMRHNHILGVLKAMETLISGLGINGSLAEDLSLSALLHDIGYSPDFYVTGFHPLDGALLALSLGLNDRVVKGILFHTGANGEASYKNEVIRDFYKTTATTISSKEQEFIDLLTYCDLSIDSNGINTSVEMRIHGILSRYSVDSDVYKNIKNFEPYFYEVRDSVFKKLVKHNKSLPWLLLDVDGTLVTPGREISEYNKSQIKKYISIGGSVSLVTGKLHVSIKSLVKETDLEKQIHITCNGAIVVKNNNEHEILVKIADQSLEIIEILQRLNIPYFIYYEDHIEYCTSSVNQFHLDHLVSISEPLPIYNKNIRYQDVIKVLAFIDESDTQTEMKVINEIKESSSIGVIRTSMKFLEFLHANQSKGNAIAAISIEKKLNMRYSIGIGDSQNDLSLLNSVGLPFIVQNASKNMKEKGFNQVELCDEDAVGKTIERIIKGNI